MYFSWANSALTNRVSLLLPSPPVPDFWLRLAQQCHRDSPQLDNHLSFTILNYVSTPRHPKLPPRHSAALTLPTPCNLVSAGFTTFPGTSALPAGIGSSHTLIASATSEPPSGLRHPAPASINLLHTGRSQDLGFSLVEPAATHHAALTHFSPWLRLDRQKSLYAVRPPENNLQLILHNW